jgi:outer membrane protein assembly factor BamB
MSFVFDVAISYVGAQIELATELSIALRSRGLQVFFDRVDVETIVGQDGPDALTRVYMQQARVCVLLLSPAYDQSAWTQIERDAVLARRTADRTAFLLPVRVAGEPPNWLPKQLLYFDLLRQSSVELIDVIERRVRRVAGASRAVPELLASQFVGIGTLKNDIIADGEWLYVPTAGTRYNEPDADDGITCVRASDLAKQWHAPTSHDANAMLLVDQWLYVGTDAGTVECIDTTNGASRWESPPRLTSAVLARPTLTPAGLLACSAHGQAALIDPASGTVFEAVDIAGGVVGDPLVIDDRLLFACQSGWIVEVPLAEPLRWVSDDHAPGVRRVAATRAGFDTEYPCTFTASPVRLEGTVFLPHSRETYLSGLPVAALERRRFQIRYTVAEASATDEDFGNIRSRPAVVNGLVIVPAAYSNRVIAFDRDGGIVWSERCGWPAFPQYGSPAAAGLDALVPRYDGALHSIDSANGQRRWSIALGIKGAVGQVYYADDFVPGEETGPSWEDDARIPLNSPVTVVGDAAYLHDSSGVLHMVGLPHTVSAVERRD